MRRFTPVFVALMLVASALAAVPAATMAQETQTERATQNATTAPGAQLSGVVGVGEAELEGEVESRSFGIRVARAATDDAKAAVVAEQLNKSGDRIESIERRREALQQARENGSMTESEYRARAAKLHAESQSAARLVNQTNETASELPAAALEAKGIDASAIKTLSQRADELSGPEVAEIARSIAGENVGESARPEAAQDRGGDARDRADNETERDGAGSSSDGTDGTEAPTNGTDATDSGTGTQTTDGSSSDGTDGGQSGNDGTASGDSGSDRER